MTALKNGRNRDGRFTKGAPGRPKGARNKATRAAQALLDGEAEALTRRAIELALAGDTVALKLCLDRLVPPAKQRHIEFELPAMATAADAVSGARAVVRAVAEGQLTPDEGMHVMGLIEALRRTQETAELVDRLDRLEAALA